MKLKNMPKEELEIMSYTDLTELLLKENKKPMNTPTIFRKICDLLGYSDDEYASKIEITILLLRLINVLFYWIVMNGI